MKRSIVFLSTISVLLITGCKTQEDIRRERTVETLSEEIQQSKKTAVNSNSRFQTLEEQISRLQGQIEEANHAKNQALTANQQLAQRIQILEETSAKQIEFIKAMTEKVNNQSGYIEEVIDSLKELKEQNKAQAKKKEVTKEEATVAATPATFANAMKLYDAKKYDEAKAMFLNVSENKKASAYNREGSLHHLGMIEFNRKNYKEAQVYFTKVFNNPESKFAAASLLHLGKSFKAQKQNEEAKMTFEELIARFPKSKEASEAQKIK